MKEEKLKLLREHQEERIRKSLERAKAEPKKITGKKTYVPFRAPTNEKETRQEVRPYNTRRRGIGLLLLILTYFDINITKA